MGYVPLTFVADEVLTSTKMNILAANQASFRDGTGLDDGIIVTRHYKNNSLTKDKLNLVQAWHDEKANRSLGATYINNRSYPLIVHVAVASGSASQPRLSISVDGIDVTYVSSTSIFYAVTGSAIVPAGSAYVVTSDFTSINLWSEMY